MPPTRPGLGRRRIPLRGAARLVVAAGLLLGRAAPAAAQAPPPGPEVAELRFVGERAVPAEALSAAIVTAETRCRNPVLTPLCLVGAAQQREYLDPDVLRTDAVRLQLLYYERGYRRAVVVPRVEPAGERVRVVFLIQEGEPVRVERVEVRDADGVFPGGVEATLPLVAGAPLDLLRYEASRDTLIAHLRNRGYAHAEVLATYLIPADTAAGAFVSYDVYPGARARFGEITVVGNRDVSPAVVRRLLTFDTGDVYRQEELVRSQRNLFGLEIFRHAQIEADLDAVPDSIVPVQVQVNEGNVHRVRAGMGLSTSECAHAEASWASRNFLGGARRLEVRSRVSNVLADPLSAFPCIDTGGGIYGDLAGLVAADFTQPWVLGPLNSLGSGVFVERQSLPDVFVRSSRGGYLSFSRRVGRSATATVAYRPELTSLEAEGDLLFCVSFRVCALREIEVLEQDHWLAPLTFRYQRDHTNSVFAPTRGDIIRVDTELAAAPTGSDFAYARVLAEWSWYRQMGGGVVFAQRIRPGWARAMAEPGRGEGLGVHPEKRFFAGGPQSVRGYAQYRLGPRVLTVNAAGVLAAPVEEGGAGCTPDAINDGTCDAAGVEQDRFEVRPVGGAALLEGNLELRFPLLGDKLRAAAFLDYGQVWSGTEDVRWDDVRWTPGLGVRYFSPIGPVRVDVGYASERVEHLSVITNRVCIRTAPETCVPPIDGGLSEGEIENTTALVPLADPVAFRSGDSFLDRLQLHFSIGQAF